MKRDDGEPKIDGDELNPNTFVVDNDVDPKRLDEVDVLKGEEPNVGVANPAKVKPPRLGLAADWPYVGEGDKPKQIPPAGR